MEPWREELYHYGVKGMKWRHKGANAVSDSGTTEEASNLRYWDKNRRKDYSYAAKAARTAQQMSEQGYNGSGVRRVARNVKGVSNYENKSFKLTKDAIDRKYHKKVKSRKNEGVSARHRGQSYIRRVLS